MPKYACAFEQVAAPPLSLPYAWGLMLAGTDFARQAAIEFAGQDNVVLQTPARLGSEDFAFMLEKVPGCYLFIGNGEGNKEGACAVHNPNYNFNDKNLVNGGAFWAYLTERYLSHAG